jgi:diguanylate cyclase (GGDEF)-like protein/PAS domain S-box-containing protein
MTGSLPNGRAAKSSRFGRVRFGRYSVAPGLGARAYFFAVLHLIRIHPTHWPEFRRARRTVLVAVLTVLLIWWLPVPEALRGIGNYLPLHGLLETLSIVVAVLVFAINWHTPLRASTRNAMLLGCTFLGVAILDFSHVWSFEGMPSMVTPSGLDKTICFWLAARSLAAGGMLLAAFLPWQQRLTRGQSIAMFAGVLALVALVHLLILAFPAWLPPMHEAGVGLTPLKVGTEYLLVAAYLAVAVRYLLHLKRPRTLDLSGLIAAACLMAMSEFLFTLYADATDLYNLAGHVAKVVAYYYLYRSLFVESLLAPYELLLEKQNQLSTTLGALPDLLFELDEGGRILDAHSGRAELLAVPPEQFMGRRFQDILPPGATQACLTAMQEARDQGTSHGQVYELDVPQGHCWFELSVAFHAGATPEKSRFVMISRDVTTRMQYEETLQQDARLNAALLALPGVADTQPLPELLRQGLEQARILTGSATAFVGRVADDGRSFLPWCAAGRTALGSVSQPWDLIDESVWTPAIHSGGAQAFNQPQEVGTDPGLPAELGPQHRWLSVPVFDGGALRLVVGVGNRETPYGQVHAKGLALLADSLWRLVRKQEVDKALRQLSTAVAQSPNPVIITDLKARIEFVNDAFTRSSGYQAGEVMGTNPRILQSGKTPEGTYHEMWAQLGRGQPWTGEFINRRKNGEEYFERALIYPVRDQAGDITHYLAHKEDITERKAATERIQFLSHFDTLTGLPNRVLLREQLDFALTHSRRTNLPLAVLWLNLDQFKDINDNFGHAGGDLLLREVTQRMRTVVREQDLLARHAGDSFVLVLPDAEQHGAVRVAAALLHALAAPLYIEGHELVITASIGVALFPTDATASEGLLRSAEAAMYRVKAEGRNGYRFFAPEMQERSARVLTLSNALRLALQREELRLVYQPQMSLNTGRLVGAEALLRWDHPQLGEISPAEFVPLAEGSGLIGQIGEWVLQAVITQLGQWLQRGLPMVKVAVNLSPYQFTQPAFPALVASLAGKAGVPTHLLELELTEAAAMKDSDLAARTMSELARLGFSLSIDDFGTGYSSLSYLKRFSVSKLKIDQSFVKDLAHDGDDQTIVGAVIDMAHSLGIVAVAEGVETDEQLAFLRQRACDEVQGYIYSRPLEVADYEAFVQARVPRP